MASADDPSPPADVEVEVKQRRGISVVWAIPLVAAAIAGWLIFTTFAEEGPTIGISFKTAEGLEAGKTEIKYKDVEVGLVNAIRVSADLSKILVTAQLSPEMQDHLTEETRFWVVRPRLGAGGVSGLGTLVSGAYIEIDPSTEGAGDSARQFTGLEVPPVVRADEAGREYTLTTGRLGGLNAGSPIFFRGIAVGEVLGYDLAADSSRIDVQIFIKEPHHDLVRPGTNFWNASGLTATLNADGVQVAMESIQSLLTGGIAFETPPAALTAEPSPEGAVFRLYDSRDGQSEESFRDRIGFVGYFDGSVRGLKEGAPVEFRGIRVGTVTDVRLEFDLESSELRIPVIFEIEPERVSDPNDQDTADAYRTMDTLVQRGLRARLGPGNLLTGALVVELDFHPDSPPAELRYKGALPEMPTLPSDLERIASSVSDVLSEVANLPLTELVEDLRTTVKSVNLLVGGPELRQSMQSLDRSLQGVEKFVTDVNNDVTPLLTSLRQTSDATQVVIERAQSTMQSADSLLSEDSVTRHNLGRLMAELAEAARSIRVFADYLEQHPEALVRGKPGLANR